MQKFVDLEIKKALVNSRLSYDHAMRQVLNEESVIVGEKAVVRVLDLDGNWVMLEKRIEQLKSDERFRDSVPSPTKIGRNDESKLRDEFEAIAQGTTVVE
jgi:hypothetical protein